jgi:hypothetical protein
MQEVTGSSPVTPIGRKSLPDREISQTQNAVDRHRLKLLFSRLTLFGQGNRDP